MLEDWNKNLGKAKKSRKSEGSSERISSEVQRTSKAKGKRKVDAVEEKEISQGPVTPHGHRAPDFTDDQPVNKKVERKEDVSKDSLQNSSSS